MMAHQIVIDQEKGIIRIVHKDIVLNHEMWGTSHALLGKLDGGRPPRILADLRGAVLKIDEWEKQEFAMAHQGVFMAGARIALLIGEDDPHKTEFAFFSKLFSKGGVTVKVFNSEYAAEGWLTE